MMTELYKEYSTRTVTTVLLEHQTCRTFLKDQGFHEKSLFSSIVELLENRDTFKAELEKLNVGAGEMLTSIGLQAEVDHHLVTIDELATENEELKAKLAIMTPEQLAQKVPAWRVMLERCEKAEKENERLKADLKALEGGPQIRGWRENNTRLVAEVKELKAALVAALNQTEIPAAGQRSQAQAINEPNHKTWEDYHQGCLGTFAGGYHDKGALSAFQHGMGTVFNLLEKEFPQPHEIFKTVMPAAINIIFDGPPGNDAPRFVEIETDNGKSISIGEWIQYGNYWKLRITELPEIEPDDE